MRQWAPYLEEVRAHLVEMTGNGAEDAGLLESLLADAALLVSRGETVLEQDAAPSCCGSSVRFLEVSLSPSWAFLEVSLSPSWAFLANSVGLATRGPFDDTTVSRSPTSTGPQPSGPQGTWCVAGTGPFPRSSNHADQRTVGPRHYIDVLWMKRFSTPS